MSTQEFEGRLWDPEAEVAGEHDELVAQLEQLLVPLQAPPPPALEFPAREGRAEGPASSSRAWVAVLLSLAAALALWLAWRAQPPPPSSRGLAQAPPSAPDVWRVEALDGESHCRSAEAEAEGEQAGQELDAGSLLEDGASLQLGGETSARLSSGDAQIELHPSSLLRNEQGVLSLREGQAWVDLPARETGTAWRFVASSLVLETRAARFMVSVEVGSGVELEVVTGELGIGGDEHAGPVHAGQLCHARFAPGPLETLEGLDCEAP